MEKTDKLRKYLIVSRHSRGYYESITVHVRRARSSDEAREWWDRHIQGRLVCLEETFVPDNMDDVELLQHAAARLCSGVLGR